MRNRVWAVLRGWEPGTNEEIRRLYWSWGSCARVVLDRDAEILEDAVFAAWPSQREARAYVESAGFVWEEMQMYP